MTAPLTLDQLKAAVSSGEIDTVVAAFADMQGRLIGKRFQAEFLSGDARLRLSPGQRYRYGARARLCRRQLG
jgi:glutamine synthetase